MFGMLIELMFMAATLPPYLVTNQGDLRVTTPTGVLITIPEGSEWNTNNVNVRLDARVITLDNTRIFGDGFE